MKYAVAIACLLLLTSCAEPHGYAAGNNEGAGIGINLLHIPLP